MACIIVGQCRLDMLDQLDPFGVIQVRFELLALVEVLNPGAGSCVTGCNLLG